MTPLVSPAYAREASPAGAAQPPGGAQQPFTRSDLLLTAAQWSGQVVGQVSPWVDPDSPDPALRRDSEAALARELSWAAHLSLQACLLPPPPRPLAAANYARLLSQVIGGLSNMALWVRVPACAPGGEDPGAGPAGDPWEWWSQLRVLCYHSTQLAAVLELGPDLPSPESLARWRGEPLK